MRSALCRTRWFVACLLSLLCTLPATPAAAGGLSPDLQAQVQRDPLSLRPVRVIVQLNRTGILSSLLALTYRAQWLGDLPLINATVLSVPQATLPLLSLDPLVAWISPDRKVGARWDRDTETLGANQVWVQPGATGRGIRVAILDTGLHPQAADLSGTTGSNRTVAWKDLVNGRRTPYDDSGHGTHVAGIVAGSGAASNGQFRGSAPSAEIVAVKVLDEECKGQVSTIIQGLTWCVQQRKALNLRVVNLSLGHRPGESYRNDPLCKAVRKAVSHGLVVVCSAGNGGKGSDEKPQYGGILSPGIEPTAITVGATNTHETRFRGDDSVASYSSRGPTYVDHLPKPDIVAPGNRIVSLRAPDSVADRNYPQHRIAPAAYGGTSSTAAYAVMSGTSMASAQVSGVVALMLQANPSLTPNATKALLMYTAQPLALRDASGQPLSPGLSLLTQGAGSVNAVGAVEVARQAGATTTVGAEWLQSTVVPRSTIAGFTFAWGQRVIWQDTLLQGLDLAGLLQSAWARLDPWGSDLAWVGNIFSRDSGVQAEQESWGQQLTWSDDPYYEYPPEEPPYDPGAEESYYPPDEYPDPESSPDETSGGPAGADPYEDPYSYDPYYYEPYSDPYYYEPYYYDPYYDPYYDETYYQEPYYDEPHPETSPYDSTAPY